MCRILRPLPYFSVHRLLAFLLVTSIFFVLNTVCLANDGTTALQGPPVPLCSQQSNTTKALMPLARIAALDAGMYAGLVILWPHAFAPSQGSTAQFHESWTQPPYMNYNKIFFELDDDPWVINGVLHGIYGSEVWMSARSMGHNGLVSFLYTVFASATWEYLVEGWFHRPSAIDLTWTPMAGAVLGELRFQLFHLIRRHVRLPALQTLLLVVLDPIGLVERKLLNCQMNCR